VIHGTQFGKIDTDFTPGGRFFKHISTSIGDRATASFHWSGGDDHASRISAATALVNFVRHYSFAPGEQLNIIAHSHGGNVAIAAINMGLGRRVDNLVTLGTPSVPAYRLNGLGGVRNWVNLFNSFDKVQTHGGGQDDSYPQTGPAARTQPGALNLSWNVDYGPLESHSALHTWEAWKVVWPHLDLDTHIYKDQSLYWIAE
jgi:hypothetical protein